MSDQTPDIVSLLRAVADYAAGALSSDEVSIAQRAADEIERLRALVLDLPDAEHIHVTRHPDGTLTAVPMEVAWIGPTDDWWRDTPGGAAEAGVS